jgi:hypothetical protein
MPVYRRRPHSADYRNTAPIYIGSGLHQLLVAIILRTASHFRKEAKLSSSSDLWENVSIKKWKALGVDRESYLFNFFSTDLITMNASLAETYLNILLEFIPESIKPLLNIHIVKYPPDRYARYPNDRYEFHIYSADIYPGLSTNEKVTSRPLDPALKKYLISNTHLIEKNGDYTGIFVEGSDIIYFLNRQHFNYLDPFNHSSHSYYSFVLKKTDYEQYKLQAHEAAPIIIIEREIVEKLLVDVFSTVRFVDYEQYQLELYEKDKLAREAERLNFWRERKRAKEFVADVSSKNPIFLVDSETSSFESGAAPAPSAIERLSLVGNVVGRLTRLFQTEVPTDRLVDAEFNDKRNPAEKLPERDIKKTIKDAAAKEHVVDEIEMLDLRKDELTVPDASTSKEIS